VFYYVAKDAGVTITHSHTHTHSVLTAIFPVEPGLAGCPLILLLHSFHSPFLDCASFWDRPKLSMSFLTQSHQVFFGRPLGLIPSTSHVIQRLTQSLSSFRSSCPNHLNLLFLIYLIMLSVNFIVSYAETGMDYSFNGSQARTASEKHL